ncbi:hypothetical protein ACFSSA_10490 [Luteolibacter algae]|uniref:Uncharacterized protein n=2 Tax=Luteolibacter algae TaxID=454151 RepID=A0ABW5D7T6_9BACT
MKKYALLMISFFSLASCAGTFPAVGVLAPRDLAGYEMDASGLKGSYHYRFFPDGTYRSEQELPSGEKKTAAPGTWSWKRSSTSDATLVLDDKLEITLEFTTRNHANATIPDSDRLYPVEFTAP